MNVNPKPLDVTWTDDQWKAIDARGNNILVAAAAGSGKTAVLVERIIRTIVDHQADVDRLLIVTFTNAAAAEMRTRIGEAIEKELKKDPGSLHLRRQLTLLNRANISTLHSFCMKVLKKYYFEVEIDPNFRLLDETEGELIREEVIDDLFEEEYGKENNHEFYAVVDRYSGDRSDDALRNLIRKLYNFSRSNPNPNQWLDELVHAYNLDDVGSMEELIWTKELFFDIHQQLEGAEAWIQKGMELTKEPAGPYKYAENFEEDLKVLYTLRQCKTWSEMYEAFQQAKFGRLKSIPKKDHVDENLKERAKKYRDTTKKVVEAIQKDYFSKEPEAFMHELKEMAPTVETTVRLVKEFAKRYMDAKKEKAVLDFNDLEHLCLQVLLDADGNELKPSKAALEFKDHFVEVLIDEYQDTNLVQETILYLLAKENNRFMVGDVKQSIYRFRLAEPSLFLDKYKTYVKSGDGDGWRIDLSKNFRSRSEILDATNFIFRQIMDESVGEIPYDTDAELHLGNLDYPEQEGLEAELAVINKGDPLEVKDPQDESQSLEEDLETSQLETRYIIQQVKKLVKEQHLVYDKSIKGQRPITYRDIVILMRSMPWASTMMEECKKEGIPVYADLSTGYFSAIEVQIVMSLLKIIDNPYQDIPLASVLRSPIVGFNEQELAHIRMMKKEVSYYDALKTTAEESPEDEIKEKAADFLEKLTNWRTNARSGALFELIWQIYRETGYFDYVGGMPGGKQRQANLRALYDRARSYESTSFRGLFRFLRFIERMQERGDDLGTARALGEQEDVVRIMTIHKSKGLEFPVVFVAGMNKKFNLQDMSASYLLHKELGFGTKFIDPKLRVAYPSIPQLAIKKRMHLESLAEEMRVLYVALTRAKEKLYLVGTVQNAEKSLENWQDLLGEDDWLLPAMDRQRGKTFMDWVGPAVLRHGSSSCYHGPGGVICENEVAEDASKWSMDIIERDTLQVEEKTEVEIQEDKLHKLYYLEPVEGAANESWVDEKLNWQYDRIQASIHRSKQTVSEMKRELEDEYSDVMFGVSKSFQSAYADRPQFLQEKGLSSTEIGTVMHTVMQHVPLTEPPTTEKIDRLLVGMYEKELLTRDQVEAVDVNHVIEFFNTDIGERMLNAKWVEREIPFSYGLPAVEAYQTWEEDEHTDGEKVLIQGVIDCIFEDENGKIILVDYKTDKITGKYKSFEDAKEALLGRYELQLSIYSGALEEIWKRDIDESILYFFDGGHVLNLEEGV
ncbi:helicase-exonuclease AddAB subunit AddA [Bacillus shivajii]|uniref:helicase-exonuclease AddAB subunit AddA n=1 Tax=Bacillus shivajii TaxID=1983719 RepID=UPI001CFBC095|nr:helicase-exonuclease AddAB subunit AddA [Bacillus shivajii]UCZ55122.1 helicase-exonuclease AddAB subunit AddA [Bacillus shivajii]